MIISQLVPVVSGHAILRLAISSYLVILSGTVGAQGVVKCDGVLIPSVESRKSDYALLQAFAKVNATALYDEISRNQGSSAGGGGSYAGFGADYQQSSNTGEFQKRTQERLATEKFEMNESDAKAYYRRGLSDAQVEAWLRCMTNDSDGGGVLLSARNADATGFHLVVTWIPQKGVGAANLELRVTGGTILGKAEVREQLTGRMSRTYDVAASSSAPVKVLGNISGSTDSVVVTQAKSRKPPPVVCLSQNQVRRYSADDNFVNAPLNRAPCFAHSSYTGTKPDIDSWYRISVPSKGSLKIVLTGLSAQFALQLRDAKGQVVKLPTPAIAAGGQIIEVNVPPGEYVIRPQPHSGPSKYDLDVSFVQDQ
jgi:hypothetical protein